jgi:hypothetical protein
MYNKTKNMEQTLSPKEIITQFEANTLERWTHHDHAVLCIHYAMMAKNVFTLMHTMRCGLIRHRSKVSREYTLEKCISKWHETKTWFWCNLFYTLVQNNRTLGLGELIKIADEKGFLKSNFILEFYDTDSLESDESKSTIVCDQSELLFFTETVVAM